MDEGQAGLTRAERRQSAHRFTRRRLVGCGLLAVVAVGGTSLALSGGERPTVVRASPTTTTSPLAPTTTLPGAPPPAVVATTNGEDLTAYASPDTASEVVGTLTAKSDYGLPRTLLVVSQQPGWIEALLPMRPNGSKGWVEDSTVTLGSTSFAMTISLEKHELTFTNAGQVVLTAPVVIGRPNTPTPLGVYYVTDPVDLTKKPSKVYGVYALGISGYSDVLYEFQGGPGQIAVHGTPSTTDFGKDISNGCVRVANDVILEISRQVPLGTPVTITA